MWRRATLVAANGGLSALRVGLAPRGGLVRLSGAVGPRASGGHLLRGLDEFYDGSANAEHGEFKAGRAWQASELRLKSFDDLHKLYFVLYKEHNKLLTEKRIAKRLERRMANPERIDKVRQSIARLKTVVNERSIEHKKSLRRQSLRVQVEAALKAERRQAEIEQLFKKAREEENVDEIVAKYMAAQAAEEAEAKAKADEEAKALQAAKDAREAERSKERLAEGEALDARYKAQLQAQQEAKEARLAAKNKRRG